MQMPVQLYALVWSNEERAAIEQWAAENEEKFAIAGFSRVLGESLHTAVQDPSIFGLAIEGVVITDHEKWPHDTLKESLKKLKNGMLDLYSLKNGLSPVVVPDPVQY